MDVKSDAKTLSCVDKAIALKRVLVLEVYSESLSRPKKAKVHEAQNMHLFDLLRSEPRRAVRIK
jgi:hypothetical protein